MAHVSLLSLSDETLNPADDFLGARPGQSGVVPRKSGGKPVGEGLCGRVARGKPDDRRANAYSAAGPCYVQQMDRGILLEHLQQARAHIAEGERHIRRQREIIDELERGGHNSELARELLATLEQVQETHVAAGERLVKMLEELR
jgi:hypothetical protein